MSDVSLTYNPNTLPTWARNVANWINGPEQSIKTCSDKIEDLMQRLATKGTWSGPAAVDNFKNFEEAHNALIKFNNQFGTSYIEIINSFKTKMSSLETLNLSSMKIDSTSETYQKIQEASIANIDPEVVVYDYKVIASIGEDLNSILEVVRSSTDALEKEIKRVGSGEGIWEGALAKTTVDALCNIIHANMPEITNNINRCIANIKEAAKNAQTVDTSEM